MFLSTDKKDINIYFEWKKKNKVFYLELCMQLRYYISLIYSRFHSDFLWKVPNIHENFTDQSKSE